MAEYLIFIHGVNTREDRDKPSYADQLIADIQRLCPTQIAIKTISLYWGDVNIAAEQDLLKTLVGSPAWKNLSFQNIRSHQLLQFVGDGALYISRAIGQLVMKRLIEQVEDGLRTFSPSTDHIHLVTHSMGTIILFDALFSSRWDATNAGGYTGVEQLRNLIFRGGSPVRSIHTMGSPISIFSLTMLSNSSLPNTHDITARLGQYLSCLCSELNTPFPWRNYLHPLDIIAMPMERLLPDILNSTDNCLNVKDIPTQDAGLLEGIGSFLPKMLEANGLEEHTEEIQLALLGGNAHNSYWSSSVVASTIVHTIESVVQQPHLQLI